MKATAFGKSSEPLTPDAPEPRDNGRDGAAAARPADTAGGEGLAKGGTPCSTCGSRFPSRNALFKHLRDPRSGCGGGGGGGASSGGESALPAPPSDVRRAARAEEKRRARDLKHRRSPKTGSTARHAGVNNSLWIGDLPVPWTRVGGKYRRLAALLFAHHPRGVPRPWIKTVVRKAYRRRTTEEREGGEYLGYAIVVYRDEEEALAVMKVLDGAEVSAETVFRPEQRMGKKKGDISDLMDVPPFRLKVRRVEKSDTSSAQLPVQMRDGAEKYKGDGPAEIAPGLDPPLTEQLRPLSKEELIRRAEKLGIKKSEEGATDTDTEKDKTESKSFVEQHTVALAKAVESYEALGPRRRVCKEGRPVPPKILQRLATILGSLRWPAQNQREGLSAERYLVLQTNAEKSDRYYGDLREACAALMEWADPAFYYSGVAVTKNFVASPHVDDRDMSFQYAVSLGEFGEGGELCVEGGSDGDYVNVVNTKDRVARVDGRHVHWVRTWDGGDRYSLIFYDTSDRCCTPVMESGVP